MRKSSFYLAVLLILVTTVGVLPTVVMAGPTTPYGPAYFPIYDETPPFTITLNDAAFAADTPVALNWIYSPAANPVNHYVKFERDINDVVLDVYVRVTYDVWGTLTYAKRARLSFGINKTGAGPTAWGDYTTDFVMGKFYPLLNPDDFPTGSGSSSTIFDYQNTDLGTTKNYEFTGMESYTMHFAANTLEPNVNYIYFHYNTLCDGTCNGTITVEYSLSPIRDDCDSLYVIQEPFANGVLDGTDETGVENTPLVEETLYRLAILDGPWNNGSEDRYDTAFSWDGTEWFPLENLGLISECMDMDDDQNIRLVVFFYPPEGEESIWLRVNDSAGNFGNNSGSMNYTLHEAIFMPDLSCADQFQYDDGDPLQSETIAATDQNGETFNGMTKGEWYAVAVTGGAWKNNGSGPDLTSIAIWNGNAWQSSGDYDYSNCEDDGVVYIQANARSLLVRVNDGDGNWGANTGSLNVSIFAADYSRFLTDCEVTYDYSFNIEDRVLPANASNGFLLGSKQYMEENLGRATMGGDKDVFEVTRYFMLETTGGPWYEENTPLEYYGTEFKRDANSWVDTEDHNAMACVANTDLLGHVRAYYSAEKDFTDYLRVNSTTFTNNTGSIGYSLYAARSLEVAPGSDMDTGTCDDYYQVVDEVGEITVQASNSGGVFVPGLTEYGEIYGIETSGGPWLNNGTPGYGVAISDDNGVTWQTLEEWDMLACRQFGSDEDHVMIFFQFVAGRRYKVRVDDTVFTDNSGSMTVSVYSTTDTLDPWLTCTDDYPKTMINAGIAIPVKMPGGVAVPGIQTGKMYAIEIFNGPWLEGAEERYDVEISNDGGQTWMDLWDDFVCAEYIDSDGNYMRVWITADSGNYRLRVNDQDADWDNNGGHLSFKLYSSYAADSGDDDDDGGTPGGAASCDSICMRPTMSVTVAGNPFFSAVFLIANTVSVLLGGEAIEVDTIEVPSTNIPDWFEYFRCAIQKWLSWCPEHTQLLINMLDDARQYEPMATIAGIGELITGVRADVDSFDWYPVGGMPFMGWSAQGGGDGDEAVPGMDLIPALESNPWDGGQLTYGSGGLETGLGGDGDYRDCPGEMREGAAGIFNVDPDSAFMDGYCFVTRTPFILKAYFVYIQGLQIVACTLILIRYVFKKWVDPAIH